MISALDVYFVMQLDTLHATLEAVIVISILSTLIGGGLWAIMRAETYGDEKLGALDKRGAKAIRTTVTTLFAALLLKTFTPTSTTAAAMLILPALTADDVMQPLGVEARRLYELLLKKLDVPVEEKDE